MSMLIDPGAFEARTGLTLRQVLPFSGYDRIVSLRRIKRIIHVLSMNDAYLGRLLSSVILTESPSARPFQDLRIQRMSFCPSVTSVGQTFVEKQKLLDLQASFYGIFEGTGI